MLLVSCNLESSLGAEKWLDKIIFLDSQANMLEGGGKTPILNPVELEQLGFRIVSYPLSLIGVSIRAMEVIFKDVNNLMLHSLWYF